MSQITVFTPAYNRAHTIVRTYESLKNQTCKDFVWMIIDDGSTDNTAELVSSWQMADNGFKIEYYYKNNGGMHTAHNVAYSKITTELNVCIDSDDAMPAGAIESILSFWNQYGNDNVAGIIALDSDFDGKIIGTMLPRNIEQADTDELYTVCKVKGDKKFIYRTDIIKSVDDYPEFEGEKLVPLGYKYSIVAQNYKMLLLNEIVCLVDYQPDGSSNTIFKQYLQSPKGFAVSNALRMKYAKTFSIKIKCCIHYIAECRISKMHKCISKSPNKLLTIILYPFGMLAEWYIYYLNRRNNQC